MNWKKFERELCELFSSLGYWALDIPKNESGAQPFDVIAIHGTKTYAVDCKTCAKKSFPIDRVEDNQWTAFEVMNSRTNADIGIMAYNDGDIYYIPYSWLIYCRENDVKSVKLWQHNLWMSKEDVKSMLGRYLE